MVFGHAYSGMDRINSGYSSIFLCNMSLITRGNGDGVRPDSYSAMAFLSFAFTKVVKFIDFGEASMTNYYMVRTGQAASLWR